MITVDRFRAEARAWLAANAATAPPDWGPILPPDQQKRAHLPVTARGDVVWCQLFSEPGAGSDLASLSTRADGDGDDFVINGQKVWTSGARCSDWGILLARTDQDAPKHRGISCF